MPPEQEKLRVLGMFSLEKAQVDFIHLYKYLKGECKENRVRLCPVVPTSRTRGNGNKLEL